MVIQEKRSIFWQLTVSVSVRKKSSYKHVSNSQWLPKQSCLHISIPSPASFYITTVDVEGYCFHVITQNDTLTFSRTPLDERSACRSGIYLRNTEHSQETNIHALAEIQTHNPSMRAAPQALASVWTVLSESTNKKALWMVIRKAKLLTVNCILILISIFMWQMCRQGMKNLLQFEQ